MNITRLATALFLIVAAIGLGFSCAGTSSQERALLPPVRSAWPGVRVDFEHGLDSWVGTPRLTAEAAADLRADADAFGRALDAGDLAAIRSTSWQPIEHWTEEGIAAKLTSGHIGPGVAESLRERLRNFSESVERLQEQR